jgi:hypothetical protein
MVNFADAVAAVPELVLGSWAEMDDDALNQSADALTRGASNRYRAHEADHRAVLGAAAWFAQPKHTLTRRVTADHDDNALTALIDRERTAAANEGIKLVGIDRVDRPTETSCAPASSRTNCHAPATPSSNWSVPRPPAPDCSGASSAGATPATTATTTPYWAAAAA